MLRIVLNQGVKFIFAEPWATRVQQNSADLDAVKAFNNGIQLFFRKVCHLPFSICVELFQRALAGQQHPSHKLTIEDDAVR